MEFLGLALEMWKQIGIAAAILLITAVSAWIVVQILDKFVVRFTRHTHTGLDDAVLIAVRPPVFWGVMLIGLEFAVYQLKFLPTSFTEARTNIFYILHLLTITWLIYRLVDHLLQWYIDEMASVTETLLDERVLPFIRRLALILIAVFAVIVLLSHFEVNVSAMVTTLGIGSLAIALAAQNTLSDTISGLVIITDRPFSLGDRVEIRELDTWGDVMDIGLRSTRIRTRDNRMVVVPNGAISKGLVVNHSVPSTVYRVQTHIGVDYGTDIDFARQVMIDAVRAQDWIMHDRKVEALFIEYGSEALVFRVRCWIENYEETRRVMDKLNSCLYRALNEHNISIGAPSYKLVHHMDKEDRDGLVSVLRGE